MNAPADEARIHAAIEAANLTVDEAEFVKERIEEGSSIDDAVTMALANRGPAAVAIMEQVADEIEAPQITEQEAEREFKKVEQAAQRYLKTAMPITARLGMPVEPCPLCTFPGLAIPRDPNEVTSDVEAAVLRLIGKTAPQAFNDAPDYERCDVCDGWGEVLTGAQKEISRTAVCNACGGKGFKGKLMAVPALPAPAPMPYPGQSVPFISAPSGIPDQWNRPAGHPHWGLDPASVGA